MANFQLYRNTSLARRILLVCSVLLILPLIFFGLLLINKESKLQKRDLELQLNLVGQSICEIAHKWIELNESTLQFIKHLLGEKLITHSLLERFSSQSTLFVVEGGVYRQSSDLSLIGQAAVFANQKLQITSLLPGQPPSLVLFIEPVGLALDLSTWLRTLAQFEKELPSFSLGLIDQQGKLFSGETLKEPISISGTFPLQDSSFKFLVSLPTDTFAHSPRIYLIDSFLHLLLLLLFLGGGLTVWLTQRMARPLKHLHQVMNQVEQGVITARYIEDSFGFEINQIGGHFNQTLEALIEQRFAKELLAKELTIGHEIQKSLFPRTIPQLPGLEVGTGFLPAREVAGDFYDLYYKKPNQLFLSIADASDKGISACLYSLLLRSLLRSQLQVQDDFAQALYEANALFCQDTGESGNFATAWIGLYDLSTQQLTYCNAGHPPALLLRSDRTICELSHGMGALGVNELACRPSIETIQLAQGDLLLLFTDGVLETRNDQGQMFGKKNLLHYFSDFQSKKPQEIVQLLFETIAQFSQGMERLDDLTFLSMRISG